MSVARSLERRLERLIEGVAGRMFSGRLHPSELAGKLAREADFARFAHPTGPATANLFVVQVNPQDIAVETSELEAILAKEMAEYAAEEGLRLEGPVTVRIETTETAAPGQATAHVEVSPGPPVTWARLKSGEQAIDVGRNRALIGRAPEADVQLSHDDVSRRHALIYRQSGQVWVQDLASANGTMIDGSRLGPDPAVLQHGSVVHFASHRYRFEEI